MLWLAGRRVVQSASTATRRLHYHAHMSDHGRAAGSARREKVAALARSDVELYRPAEHKIQPIGPSTPDDSPHRRFYRIPEAEQHLVIEDSEEEREELYHELLQERSRLKQAKISTAAPPSTRVLLRKEHIGRRTASQVSVSVDNSPVKAEPTASETQNVVEIQSIPTYPLNVSDNESVGSSSSSIEEVVDPRARLAALTKAYAYIPAADSRAEFRAARSNSLPVASTMAAASVKKRATTSRADLNRKQEKSKSGMPEPGAMSAYVAVITEHANTCPESPKKVKVVAKNKQSKAKAKRTKMQSKDGEGSCTAESAGDDEFTRLDAAPLDQPPSASKTASKSRKKSKDVTPLPPMPVAEGLMKELEGCPVCEEEWEGRKMLTTKWVSRRCLNALHCPADIPPLRNTWWHAVRQGGWRGIRCQTSRPLSSPR